MGNLLVDGETGFPDTGALEEPWRGNRRSACRYTQRGGARGDAVRATIAETIETVGTASRGCGNGVVVGVGAAGARKCRVWSKLRHTGQSDASCIGPRRGATLGPGERGADPDSVTITRSTCRATPHA
jgi:hypothetical protein